MTAAYNSADKILSREQLMAKAQLWRFKNMKIVFTNGCFDLLHLGHADYLEKARLLGAVLVVGLNTDASVQRIKGISRPLQDEVSRARLMAALEFVDAVTLFDEDTPLDLITALKPDILVKGDDYTPDNIVGSEVVLKNGGEVLTIPLVEGHSTSRIVEKIRGSDNG